MQSDGESLPDSEFTELAQIRCCLLTSFGSRMYLEPCQLGYFPSSSSTSPWHFDKNSLYVYNHLALVVTHWLHVYPGISLAGQDSSSSRHEVIQTKPLTHSSNKHLTPV